MQQAIDTDGVRYELYKVDPLSSINYIFLGPTEHRALPSITTRKCPFCTSPIGLYILCDIESNMCCTKISALDYFSKSRNCNLHLLVHKVLLKHRWEYEIKQTPSCRYIYWKTVAEVYPFERCHYSPSRPLATDGEQLVQEDLESANIVSQPKVILVAPVYLLVGNLICK